MNVIQKLEKMSMYQLQKICQKVNVRCPKTKRNAIKKLLKPLKMKYKMKNMTVNEKILQKLEEYRKQKEQKKLQQKKAVSRGFNKKQKCYKEIQEVNEIIYRIQRNIFLKNPVSKYQNQYKLLEYRTKILEACLQGKKSSNVRP